MRFGICYEHQLLKDALEQVELADRLGVDYLWLVEHHFLEEYSHSSAPEVFLAAASQRTSRIRLGHGIVQLPPAYNHPARVAERIATLDLLSDGRVEFGTGESSSEAELGGFGIARDDKRAQWGEALEVVTRMLVEEPFAGHKGRFIHVPPRNVVPKPLQRPHPPLWVACSRRETIHLAATKGIGALSFSFIEPDRAKEWVDDYYATIASEACVPGGFAVNPQVACVLPLLCHRDEETAIQRGLGSLRGAIGTPSQIRELIRGYQAAGVDQLVFVSQAGRTRHEHVCESLELFVAEVLPEFAEHADEHDRAKADRLGDAVQAALARRDPPRTPPAGYTISGAMRF